MELDFVISLIVIAIISAFLGEKLGKKHKEENMNKQTSTSLFNSKNDESKNID